MKIFFSPQCRPDTLTLEKSETDRLRINGELFNFDPLPDGGIIPAGAVPCEWIVGPVERIAGEVYLTVILPHGNSPLAAVAYPAPISVTAPGLIAIPGEEEQTDVVS